MGVWDTTTPLGTESKSLGDDRIRELKTAIQESLRGQAASGVEAVFPGPSPSTAPVYRYRGLRDTTANRPIAGSHGLYTDTTRNVLQRDNGSTWDDVATLIPAGTVMVFYQAAAPTGWTKVVTQNDKALRVVSGSGGVAGGTVPLSTSLAHTHTVASHTHTGPSHTHSTPNHTHDLADGPGASSLNTVNNEVICKNSNGLLATFSGGGSGVAKASFTTESSGAGTTGAGGTGVTGAASPATDSQLGALAYADVILASKD